MEVIEAYRNILLCIHNRPPHLSLWNVRKGAKQLENMVTACEQVGSFAAIRAQVNLQIMNMDQEMLNRSIAQDPVRYLNIATPLQCRQIFDEALVHLTGSYPIWTAFPTSADTISPDIMTLIKKKAEQLRRARDAVDREIILDLFIPGADDKPRNPRRPGDFEDWFICNLIRDRYCIAVRKCQIENPTDGTLYRMIADGGEEFLSADELQQVCSIYQSELSGKYGSFLDVRETLDQLKAEMKESVRDLVVNNTRVKVDDVGLKYLTCTKVVREDYPWHMEIQREESPDDDMQME